MFGDISFSAITETSSKGIRFSVLKFHFNGDGTSFSHNMEVVVCKENKTDTLPLGIYNVKAIESF
ncbi:MAG: hypothetical protein ACJAWH_002317 [Maribacter sp.]|jgi:hypothetical protein